MKKRIIFSIIVLLITAAVLFIASMMQPVSVIRKSEMRFCASDGPALLENPNRKLIKTGRLSFEAADLEKMRNRMESLVKRHNGFFSDEQLSTFGKYVRQELTIRVPAEQFDALVSAILDGNERLHERNIEIEDVTNRYLDIETRLAVKRELEARYRELLADAEDVKDLLAIEEQIAALRETIESAEKQLKTFNDRIALSTLRITLMKKTDVRPVQLLENCRRGFKTGWNNLNWAVIGLINIWPFILIVFALVFGFRLRRYKKAKR